MHKSKLSTLITDYIIIRHPTVYFGEYLFERCKAPQNFEFIRFYTESKVLFGKKDGLKLLNPGKLIWFVFKGANMSLKVHKSKLSTELAY